MAAKTNCNMYGVGILAQYGGDEWLRSGGSLCFNTGWDAPCLGHEAKGRKASYSRAVPESCMGEARHEGQKWVKCVVLWVEWRCGGC